MTTLQLAGVFVALTLSVTLAGDPIPKGDGIVSILLAGEFFGRRL